MAGKGAPERGKVECPVCGARAGSTPFGTEGFRRVSTRVPQHSDDPVIAARRNRASRLRALNRSA